MTTKFTDGGATITVDGGMERFVRAMLTAANTETVRVLESGAGEVAAKAASDWYGPDGVTWRTGASGRIDVVTTIDTGRGDVRVSTGSTDTKTINGKPRAVYIHRPGPLSRQLVEITGAEYKQSKAAGGAAAALVFRARRSDEAKGIEAGKAYRTEPNPKASNGAFLLTILIKVPMRAKIKEMAPLVAKAIAGKVS